MNRGLNSSAVEIAEIRAGGARTCLRTVSGLVTCWGEPLGPLGETEDDYGRVILGQFSELRPPPRDWEYCAAERLVTAHGHVEPVGAQLGHPFEDRCRPLEYPELRYSAREPQPPGFSLHRGVETTTVTASRNPDFRTNGTRIWRCPLVDYRRFIAHDCGLCADHRLLCRAQIRGDLSDEVTVIADVERVFGGISAAVLQHVNGRFERIEFRAARSEAGQSIPAQIVHRGELSTNLDARSLVHGDDHACALDENGVAWCWGRNDSGQLGDGTYVSRAQPTRVRFTSRVRQLTAGARHTCALAGDSSIWCWGDSSLGRLGNGRVLNQQSPVAIHVPEPAIEVAVGDAHSCARTRAGNVYCWGSRITGATGLWDSYDVEAMNAIPGIHTSASLTRSRAEPAQVAIGAQATSMLTLRTETCVRTAAIPTTTNSDTESAETNAQTTANSQRLWSCWGAVPSVVDKPRFHAGAIAARQRSQASIDEEIVRRLHDRPVDACQLRASLGDRTFTHCTIDPAVICDPRSPHANCVLPERDYRPELVHSIDNVVGVSLGRWHACAWDRNGAVFCWGSNSAGQIGTHAGFDPALPTRVSD